MSDAAREPGGGATAEGEGEGDWSGLRSHEGNAATLALEPPGGGAGAGDGGAGAGDGGPGDGDAEPAPSERAGPRSSLGKFHFLERIGRGGMGEVYLALISGPTGFNKLVVVKTLREDFAAYPSIRAMFLDEGRLAARLNHPNVVQTNEVGVEEGKHYLVMEYLEGQPLDRLIRRPRDAGAAVPPGLCLRIALDTLGGLHYAHELCDYDGTPLNVVHRDLSPHNVFLTYEGVVKVLDFGIAKAATQSAQTQAGTIKGKPAYMPPEQLLGTAVDRRADLFVFGIVLWEMFTGARLFTGTLSECLKRIMGGPLPLVSSVVPGFDPGLDAVVARALERDPEARFQTAQEMRDALVAAAGPGAIPPQEAVGEMMRAVFRERREQRRLTVQRYVSEHLRNPGASRGIAALSPLAALPPPARIASSPSLPSAVGVAATVPSARGSGARASQPSWPETTGATMSVGASDLVLTAATPGQGAYAFGAAPGPPFGPPPLPTMAPAPAGYPQPSRPPQGRAVLWAGLFFGLVGLGSVVTAAWLLTTNRGPRRDGSALTVAAPASADAPAEPPGVPPPAAPAETNAPPASASAAPPMSASNASPPPGAIVDASSAAPRGGGKPRGSGKGPTVALPVAAPSPPPAAPSAAPRPSQEPARRPGRTFRTELDLERFCRGPGTAACGVFSLRPPTRWPRPRSLACGRAGPAAEPL